MCMNKINEWVNDAGTATAALTLMVFGVGNLFIYLSSLMDGWMDVACLLDG